MWAVVRPAPTERRTTNRTSAAHARFATTLVDGESFLHASVPIWSRVVINRCATCLDRFAQHTHNRGVQPLNLDRAQGCGNSERVELRTPERLVNIDIAEAGKEALVKEEALQPTTSRRKHRLERGDGEGHLQWLRPMVTQRRVVGRIERSGGGAIISPRNKGESTEGADITEADLTPISQRQDRPNIRINRCSTRKHEQLTGHAQMHHQDKATFKINQDPLCSSSHPFNASTSDRTREGGWIWRAEICRADDSARVDSRTCDHLRKITRNRLNLWEFRHARSNVASRPIGVLSSPPR